MTVDARQKHFESLSYSEKLLYVVANWNAASFAYERLAVHRSAAIKQMARLWDAIAKSKPSIPEPKPGASQEERRVYILDGIKRMRPVVYEAHFYFVAWGGCRNMLEVLAGQPEFLEAKKVYDSYRKHFEHYVSARNSFEHFHDRLPGQPEEKRVKEVHHDPNSGLSAVYLGLQGGTYKHSDSSWDITPASLELLNRAIDEVLAVVHRTIDEQIRLKFITA